MGPRGRCRIAGHYTPPYSISVIFKDLLCRRMQPASSLLIRMMEAMSQQNMAASRPFKAAQMPRRCRIASTCATTCQSSGREAGQSKQVDRRAVLASLGAAALLSGVSPPAMAELQVISSFSTHPHARSCP